MIIMYHYHWTFMHFSLFQVYQALKLKDKKSWKWFFLYVSILTPKKYHYLKGRFKLLFPSAHISFFTYIIFLYMPWLKMKWNYKLNINQYFIVYKVIFNILKHLTWLLVYSDYFVISYQPPQLAISSLYWKGWTILIILAACNPVTIGKGCFIIFLRLFVIP